MISNSGISSTPYAAKARHVMEVAQQLRDVGAQTLLDIPRIAVIGGQSAGKSSLVEAISGIRVPRSSGTCTRCPMEVNLTSSPEPWNCRVSLRIQFNRYGTLLKEVQKVPFGPILFSNGDAELQLMRAQAAILSYRQFPPEFFLGMNQEQIEVFRANLPNPVLHFSKNVICVDIRGPDCTDVAFVDLPGLVQNDTRELIEFVEDVVRSNIQGRCLILVAIPMCDDMENQRSMRIALETDPERVRTIGVLTKPDTLSRGATGAYQRWMDIMTGQYQAHALKLGYYCVKLADDEERSRNLSRIEREQREMELFNTMQPWSCIIQMGKFGVRSVVTDLSRHLTDMLDQTLPELDRQAKNQLAVCKCEIAKLPKPLMVDPTTEIHNRVADFSQDLSAAVKGRDLTSDNELVMVRGKSLVQANKIVYEKFKDSVRVTAPDFRPFDDHTKHDKPPFAIEDEDSLDSEEAGKPRCGPFDFRYVRRVIKDSIAWELPNNVHFNAKRQLISNFTRLWDVPAATCCDEVVSNLEIYLMAIVKVHFKRYPKLLQQIRDLVMDLVESQKTSTAASVDIIVGLEKDPLFTQNTFSLDAYRERCLARYREIRRKTIDHRKPSERQINVNAGYLNLKEEDHTRLVPPDQFEQEMIVMADVRAYFQVAYKRIIDYVPLIIEHSLNQSLLGSMKNDLLKKLELGAPGSRERLAELLEEDLDIRRHLEELQARKTRLEQISKELRSL